MASTTTIRNTLDWAMSKPSLTSVLGNPVAGYGGTVVPIRISNKVLQDVLQSPFAWKWNRRVPAPFVINQLQQDYSTSILDLGWLEDSIQIEINNPMYPPPSPPNYPTRGVEAVRELLPTDSQGPPAQICWVYNTEAIAGTWAPGIVYTNPGLGTELPLQPLTQIRDSNGNLQVLTTFGTCGGSVPAWSTVANQTTPDGSSVWTMADPNGIAWRISPCPAQSGIVKLIQPYYQKKPTTITNVNQLWTIPDELSNLFETGFIAYAWEAAEDEQKFERNMALFQARIKKALIAGDREPESYCMYPSRSITGVSGYSSRDTNQYPPGLFSN
jgi:hypothetical protein